MLNLLGDIWFDRDDATPREPDWPRVLAHGKAKLHLYGKREARRGRKMGHVTCLGATLDEALATARAIKRDLGIPMADGPERRKRGGPSDAGAPQGASAPPQGAAQRPNWPMRPQAWGSSSRESRAA